MFCQPGNHETGPRRPLVRLFICPVLPLPTAAWRKLISGDEWQRMQGIRHPGQAHANATRAWMRRFLLGSELSLAAHKVSIVTDRCGRHHSRNGRYHLASSATSRYVATTCTAEEGIGIDIEEERTLLDAEGVAAAFLTTRERRHWRNSGKHNGELFRLWCCKEAMLKGEGIGFGGDFMARELSPELFRQGRLHCHCLSLTPPTWCAIHARRPVAVAIYLLGANLLQHALASRLNDPQVIEEILRKLADMRLNPATLRLV